MEQRASSEEAYRERAARRKELFKKYPKLKDEILGNGENNTSYSGEFMKRRLAPYAYLLISFTLLFGLSHLILGGTNFLQYFEIGFRNNGHATIKIPTDNQVYHFQIEQVFLDEIIPEYSELEIELLDDDFDHQYSFYKDLWEENHPNDEGSYAVYSDTKMEFDLLIDQPGTYHLRAISHNGNNALLKGFLHAKNTTNYYYLYYFYFFGGLLLVMIIFGDFYGGFFNALRDIGRIRDIKRNKLFIFSLILASLLYMWVLLINVTHYGAPEAGKTRKLPSKFFPTETVIYIG